MVTLKRIDKTEVLDIPSQMVDPSYVEEMAKALRVLTMQGGKHTLSLNACSEIVLNCIARGLWQPSAWKAKDEKITL